MNKWYDICEILAGERRHPRTMKTGVNAALDMAKEYKDQVPEAAWLVDTISRACFPEDIDWYLSVQDLLDGEPREPVKGLAKYVAWKFGKGSGSMIAARQGGYAPIIFEVLPEEVDSFTSQMAAAGDRRAIMVKQFWLSANDQITRVPFLIQASQLGDMSAMMNLVRHKHAPVDACLKYAAELIRISVNMGEFGWNYFQKHYFGYIDNNPFNKRLFGRTFLESGMPIPAVCVEVCQACIDFYRDHLVVIKSACTAWICVAKRMGLNPDVRRVVSKIIWEEKLK